MNGYDAEAAKAYILAHLDKKPFRSISGELPQMIGDMIAYDLHFMKVTGVVDENGEQGDNEYDDDEDMMVAALLNEYMDLQYRYLCESGLADV